MHVCTRPDLLEVEVPVQAFSTRKSFMNLSSSAQSLWFRGLLTGSQKMSDGRALSSVRVFFLAPQAMDPTVAKFCLRSVHPPLSSKKEKEENPSREPSCSPRVSALVRVVLASLASSVEQAPTWSCRYRSSRRV